MGPRLKWKPALHNGIQILVSEKSAVSYNKNQELQPGQPPSLHKYQFSLFLLLAEAAWQWHATTLLVNTHYYKHRTEIIITIKKKGGRNYTTNRLLRKQSQEYRAALAGNATLVPTPEAFRYLPANFDVICEARKAAVKRTWGASVFSENDSRPREHFLFARLADAIRFTRTRL